MVTRRMCAARGPTGEPCQSPPLHDNDFCFMHSPEHAQEAQEARKLGRLRHKREATISGAFDIGRLETMEGIRRILEIALMDTLGMDNSLSRNRTLAYLVMVALKIKEVGDIEQRLVALEQSVNPHNVRQATPIFDAETSLLESGNKEKDA